MFDGPLSVTQIGANRWRVNIPFTFYGRLGGHTVPDGYVSDFASVPRPFRWLFPKSGLYNQAAVLHDYFYTNLYTKYTKAYADQCFFEAMAALNVPKWRRLLMYWAVRVNFNGGGW